MNTQFDEQCLLEEELATNKIESTHMDFVLITVIKATKNSKIDPRGANNTPTKN